MKDHADILRILINNGCIERVDGSTDIDVSLVKELYEGGLVQAIDASTLDGPEYLDVKPNLKGREWLANFEAEKGCQPASPVDDIVDIKPNFMGIGLNINALFRKLFKKT